MKTKKVDYCNACDSMPCDGTCKPQHRKEDPCIHGDYGMCDECYASLDNCQHNVIARTCTECKPQHTPTPWRVGAKASQCVYGADESPIFMVDSMEEHTRAQEKIDAAFIVRAVNSHEELLNALKDVCYAVNNWPESKAEVLKIAQSAIAKAEGR